MYLNTKHPSLKIYVNEEEFYKPKQGLDSKNKMWSELISFFEYLSNTTTSKLHTKIEITQNPNKKENTYSLYIYKPSSIDLSKPNSINENVKTIAYDKLGFVFREKDGKPFNNHTAINNFLKQLYKNNFSCEIIASKSKQDK